jgi:peptidylprolyl isomerase
MRHSALILLMAASTMAVSAQTTPKPAAPAAAAKPAATATKSATAAVKPHPGGPPVVRSIPKVAFSLRYQEIKVGTGALAEPNKLYKVHYTGWRAADGVKFDSSYDHPGPPLKDKDGKPILGDDGKPKTDAPQPMPFPQGVGRAIPGFDQGFAGMKVGGKRRLLIPWQLAYGTREIPARGDDRPGIPAKSDLIFDVELIDMTDMPAQPARPGMGGMPPGHPMPGGNMPPHPGTPSAPGTPATPAKPASPPAAGAPTAPATSTAPSTAPATATPSTPAAPTAPATPAQPQSK